jgi:hypothetical protein
MENLTYVNSKYGFAVDYPADWCIFENLGPWVLVAFSGPYVLAGNYNININVQ